MAEKGFKTVKPLVQAVINKGINAINSNKPGHIYSNIPFKYTCKAGRVYMWCACGWSKNQPFCDGTHHDPRWRIKIKPIRFECNETRDYWFCQCKQTSTRPFCDGTHNTDEVVNQYNKNLEVVAQPGSTKKR